MDFENYMTLNTGKCHFMCLGKDTAKETVIFKNLLMSNNKEQKLFRVAIGNKLNCKSHIKKLCKNVLQK